MSHLVSDLSDQEPMIWCVPAFEALNQAEQIMQIHHVRLATRVELKASRVAQWLAVGDLEMASHWAQECNGGSELEQITLARLKLAQGRADEAYDLLDQQRLLAETGGRIGRLIEILGLLSLTLNAQDQPEDAQIMLNQAIYYAKPERYLRIFLDFGKPLYTILERSMIGNTSLPDLAGVYISNLLNTLDREIKASKVSSALGIPQQSSVSGASLDPLTERELDVLRLLAEGLTNKDIASRLVVAPSTIKQHLKNIYCKLDVHSRTQAVARSRELGLI